MPAADGPPGDAPMEDDMLANDTRQTPGKGGALRVARSAAGGQASWDIASIAQRVIAVLFRALPLSALTWGLWSLSAFAASAPWPLHGAVGWLASAAAAVTATVVLFDAYLDLRYPLRREPV